MHTALLLKGILLLLIVLGSIAGILRLFWLIMKKRTERFGKLSIILLAPVLLGLLYVLGMFIAEWRTLFAFLRLVF